MKKMPSWLKKAVFYEIYPQSYYDSNGDGIGDLPGITQKLDYIRDSGFNVLWLNPCFSSPFRDAGYDISDFFQIAPRYGTNEDARTLFREAHARGLHVILDLVICHTALEHPWLAESGKVEHNDKSDFYIWCPVVSYRGDRSEPDDYYVSGWAPRGSFKASFFAVQPAINYGFNKVRHPWEMPYKHPACVKNRSFIKEVMRFWLDLGCDGFRVDMAGSLIKRDPECKLTRRAWKEIRTWLDKEYPEAVLVSEWFEPKYSLTCGFHIDFACFKTFRNDNWMYLKPTQWKIPFGHDPQSRGELRKWIQEYLRSYKAAGKKGYIGLFSGNHDCWRLRWYNTLRGMTVRFALLLTMPGCPFIYYGDEIGMRYLPGLFKEGSGSRGGSRTPMQWDHSANLGFSTASSDKLYLPVDSAEDAPVAEDAVNGKNEHYTYVCKLTRLRSSTPELQADADFEILHGKDGSYPFAFSRGEKYIVVINPADEKASWDLPAEPLENVMEFHAVRNGETVIMEDDSFCIYRMK